MYGRAPPGAPRWLRLRPADPWDVVLIVAAVLGLIVTLVHHLTGELLAEDWVTIALALFVRAHGSAPLLTQLAAAFYLTRGGRVMGRSKLWVWAGVVVAVPLWFLGGLPISIRFGDVTFLVIPWNLLVFALMAIGAARTLGRPSSRGQTVQSS